MKDWIEAVGAFASKNESIWSDVWFVSVDKLEHPNTHLSDGLKGMALCMDPTGGVVYCCSLHRCVHRSIDHFKQRGFSKCKCGVCMSVADLQQAIVVNGRRVATT